MPAALGSLRGEQLRSARGRPARPPRDLPRRRQWADRRPDPRHDQLLAPLGGGGGAARRLPQGGRAGPDRPRRLGDAARRLLARRPRGQHPRPADDDRGRAGDDRRPLARRRRGDAVLLPVPPAHRAPRAGLQRRPRPRGQPAAARRGAAGGLPAAAAGRAAPPGRRDRRRRRPGCAPAAAPRASTSRRWRGRCARCRSRARGGPSCRRCGR